MAGFWKGVLAKVGRWAGRPDARRQGATLAQVARRRHVAAVQRRRLRYAPGPDGRADPGGIGRTWVAHEDDSRQGKDRPVLVVGRDSTLFGLMLSSQRDRDGQPHRLWVRLDRVLTMQEDSIRRQGAVRQAPAESQAGPVYPDPGLDAFVVRVRLASTRQSQRPA